MKQKLVFFFSILFCGILIHPAISQNWGKGIKGEGPIVTKVLDVDKFTGLKLAFSGDLILTRGNTQSVKVEGQANIIDLIKTEVDGDIWKIGFKKNVSNHKGLKVYVTVPMLTELGLSGSGNIASTNTFDNLNELKVYVSGSGDIKLELEANSLETSISGSGNISLSGSTDTQNISISGSGDVSAYKLTSNNAMVRISGSGECEINVNKNLEVKISGSGDVSYKGNPKVRSKVTGSGDVKSD